MSNSQTDQPRPLYLNGQWVTQGPPLAVTNPATLDTIAHVSTADAEAVHSAISAAHAAFNPWRNLTGKERGAFLRAIADNIERRTDDIARTITLENGKPLAQSRGEVAMTVDHLQWFAEEARRAYGRVIPPQAPGKRHLVLKQPVGVVAAIAPWNFPLVLSVRKAAPAMAAGCPVILKPASATPLCALMLAEAVHEAGLPAGVFQVVAGKANIIADAMLSNPLCRKITFTGSTEVGRQLMQGAAAQIKGLSLELGGHAPVLVFNDADLEQAVEGALITKFRNTGQSCIASNRIYVQRGIYDAFLERFAAKTKALRVGNGLEEGIDIGPLIDEGALRQALAHIEDSVSRGAEVICGGRAAKGAGPGHFLEPTVLANVPAEAQCMTEETFAPVAPVAVFDEEDEGIARANDTSYGLAAYAFTRDITRAWRLAECLDAGTIGLNDAVPSTSQCPFGGTKQSGLGRELGMEGLDAFLETKHVSLGGINP